MDINPATRGHLLCIPREHAQDLLAIARGGPVAPCTRTAKAMAGRVAERARRRRREHHAVQRPAAWQTVFHFHVHVIPRYDGDPLRLPWVPEPGRRTDEIAAAGAELRA